MRKAWFILTRENSGCLLCCSRLLFMSLNNPFSPWMYIRTSFDSCVLHYLLVVILPFMGARLSVRLRSVRHFLRRNDSLRSESLQRLAHHSSGTGCWCVKSLRVVFLFLAMLQWQLLFFLSLISFRCCCRRLLSLRESCEAQH